MANTHDYSIANDTGSAVRTDLNTLFTEVEATNAGATAPSNLATGKLWYDTANNELKQYNGSAWVVVQSGTTPDIGTPSAGVVTNLSGVLPVGVTGGSGLDAVSPANLASGVLPAGVTGGSGLTALGTVASGVLEDAVTYRSINQDLGTGDTTQFAEIGVNEASPDRKIHATFSSDDGLKLENTSQATTELLSTGSTRLRSSATIAFDTNGSTQRLLIGTTGVLTHSATEGGASTAIHLMEKINGREGNSRYMTFSDNSGNIGYIQNNGGITNMEFSSASDVRLKENIIDIPNCLDLVTQILPRFFDMKNGSKNNAGFIADEVEQVFPEWVSTDGSEDNFKIIPSNLVPIIPYLIGAIKELSAKNDALEARIEVLESA
tara:strand:- start:81 stop:1214 length:1134 start_codon:yes stop_codon:yes gene_type:complete